MTGKPQDVPVEIFGQTYTVRGESDPTYLSELAGQVDARMREVSQTAGPVDTVRVAVLAALNLADECHRLRETARQAKEETVRNERRLRERAQVLVRQLSAATEE